MQESLQWANVQAEDKVLDKTTMASSSHNSAIFLLNNACVWQTVSHAQTCGSEGILYGPHCIAWPEDRPSEWAYAIMLALRGKGSPLMGKKQESRHLMALKMGGTKKEESPQKPSLQECASERALEIGMTTSSWHSALCLAEWRAHPSHPQVTGKNVTDEITGPSPRDQRTLLPDHRTVNNGEASEAQCCLSPCTCQKGRQHGYPAQRHTESITVLALLQATLSWAAFWG